MNISSIINKLCSCPCGREHAADIRAVEIERGALARTAEILRDAGFPRKILVVADENTLSASNGIIKILENGGFSVKLKMFYDPDPTAENVAEVCELCTDIEGILSVGTGTLNDIGRRAALLSDREFAIFATAPSMDGFASGTSPIIENGFKSTLPARQPSVIIADTAILAQSPARLKASGFGDIIGKYTAIVDWRVANLTVGEYYCNNVANLVRDALSRICLMAHRVTAEDAETARTIMEILVFAGLSMKLAGCSRPASGAEHMISHMIGMRKLSDGKCADLHGRKVGVGALALCDIYRRAAELDLSFENRPIDWDTVYSAYGDTLKPNIIRENSPPISDKLDIQVLNTQWSEIAKIVREELPETNALRDILRAAGAPTTFAEIDTEDSLARECLKYHPYMRDKIVLSRLLTMADFNLESFSNM